MEESRRGNVETHERDLSDQTVVSKVRKARRKTLDVRSAMGLQGGLPPEMLRAALKKHFLFGSSSESELDSVIAVMA